MNQRIAWSSGAEVSIRSAGEGAVWLRIVHDGDRVGLPASFWADVPDHFVEEMVYEPAVGVEKWSAAGIRLTFSPSDGLSVTDAADRPIAHLATSGMRAGPGLAEVAIDLAPGADVYGLGPKMGPLSRKGRQYRFWNTDHHPHLPDTDPLYLSLPFALMIGPSGAAGLAVGWAGESAMDVGAERSDQLLVRTIGGGLDLLLIAGPTPGEVVRRFTRVIGRPCLPPLWALGYQQSHYGYEDATTLLDVAQQFRAKNLGLDVIYSDLDHMDHCQPFTWDRDRFSDPAQLLHRLHDLGVHFMPITNSGVPVNGRAHAAAAEAGALLKRPDGTEVRGGLWAGEVALLDVFRPEAERIWQKQHAEFVRLGVDGMWNDMNEPTLLGEEAAEVVVRPVPPDALHGPIEDVWRHDEVRNLYPVYLDRASYRALTALRPDRRPFVLSRAGFFGVGRYAAVWTGDNHSWWEHLRQSLGQIASTGLCGVPLSGVDVGGFSGSCSPELFARWIEAAALMPFARNHSSNTSPRQEPWQFGPEVEEIARQALSLRYRFLPYLYSLAYAAHVTGEPIWRPLPYVFPDHPPVRHLEDEVMLGDFLLIAPVLEPGVTSRRVTLPPGTWRRLDAGFEGGVLHEGDHLAQAPLGSLPLFGRGGGIFALDGAPVGRARVPDRLDIHVIPGGPGRFVLFEDDGVSYEFLHDEARWTEFEWHEHGGVGMLTLRSRGALPGAELVIRLPRSARVQAVKVNGRPWNRALPLPSGLQTALVEVGLES